jgi:hypothetical protein
MQVSKNQIQANDINWLQNEFYFTCNNPLCKPQLMQLESSQFMLKGKNRECCCFYLSYVKDSQILS